MANAERYHTEATVIHAKVDWKAVDRNDPFPRQNFVDMQEHGICNSPFFYGNNCEFTMKCPYKCALGSECLSDNSGCQCAVQTYGPLCQYRVCDPRFDCVGGGGGKCMNDVHWKCECEGSRMTEANTCVDYNAWPPEGLYGRSGNGNDKTDFQYILYVAVALAFLVAVSCCWQVCRRNQRFRRRNIVTSRPYLNNQPSLIVTNEQAPLVNESSYLHHIERHPIYHNDLSDLPVYSVAPIVGHSTILPNKPPDYCCDHE